MAEIGEILEGKVTGITKFGAFVELSDGKTGMVHISEVSNTYVEDINQFLKEGDEVKVKVINVTEEGKISLSIKKALPKPQRPQGEGRPGGDRKGAERFGNRDQKGGDRGPRQGSGRPFQRRPRFDSKPCDPQSISSYEWNPRKQDNNLSFEDMMSKFKQTSDDKMSDLKKVMGDVKRGSANRRSNKQ